MKLENCNLNSFYLYVHFLSSFNCELRSRFWGTIIQIAGSTQSTIPNRNILWPYKSEQKTKDTKERQLQFKIIMNETKL